MVVREVIGWGIEQRSLEILCKISHKTKLRSLPPLLRSLGQVNSNCTQSMAIK